MPIQPLLDAGTAAANMAEIKPPYTPQEALIEANRCLFCFDAPCIMACPTGIDIPSFIKKIANGNLTGSARTILTSNVLGASCARVCPTEVLCEGACVVLDLEGDPVKIGRLQRHATDHVYENGIEVLHAPAEKNGRSVAVLGAGPAGLGCAAELAQLGYGVTVFDKKPEGGGLNTYGIAYYKMRPEISIEEVRMIGRLGVEFRYDTAVGRDISVADLERDFDALFLGLGLGGANRLGIPGEDLPEVVDALDFIEWIRTRPLQDVPVGRRVAVLGCGNTAIDAVTQSKRLGADTSTIIYRRGEEDMPAYHFEYDLAKADGAGFLFHTIPLEVLGENGHVKALRLAKTEVRDGKVSVVPGSEWIEPFDLILKAVGQEKQTELFTSLFPGLKLDRKGRVEHDPATMQTSLPKLFVGGDCANGGREVVNAVAEGRKAARGIHAMLGGGSVSGPVQPSRHGASDGAVGSGFNNPIRVPELLAAMSK
ncbi:MAG: NAD(P)-dependent oxidoreductase [Chthoniobacterales bacterium]|nr:NAD(P)-dependent oxidoreductase [Chthoniobacterales bacterium]